MITRTSKAWLVAAAVALACDAPRPGYSPRSTPPEVAFAVPPPEYTSSASLALRIAAKNLTGVKAVYALAGTQRWAGSQDADGTWKVAVQLPAIGRNAVAVWAEDGVAPTPNSGQGQDPPYQLVQDVFYDPTPPSISYDPTFASYTDERALSVEVDDNGAAKVPPAYGFGPKAPVLAGGAFYKAATRLSAGSMEAAKLETTNENNTPVLRFVVPFNPNTDAPLSAPTFIAHVTCPSPCPAFPDASGQLLASSMSDNGRAFFILPLSTETIPALARVQGTASISITLTVADGAGNSTTEPGFDFKFHVLGPSLAIVEDSEYPASAKPESVYAYHLADGSYASQWQPLAQFPNFRVRLLRYIITNPNAVPVALQLDYAQDPEGSWRAVETWKRFSTEEPTGRNADGRIWLNRPDTSTPFVIDGFTFHNAMYWSWPYGTIGELAQGENGPHPCGSTHVGRVMHRMGDMAKKYVCSTEVGVNPWSSTPEVDAFSAADVSIWPYRVATELGGQEREPELDPSGQWVIVPPAAGGVPGAIVVYLARPGTAARSRPLDWNLAVATPGVSGSVDPVDHYQTWDYEWWYGYYQPWNVLYPDYDTYVAFRTGTFLVAAEDHLSGSFTGRTQAFWEGQLLGEATPRLSVTLARAPLATH